MVVDGGKGGREGGEGRGGTVRMDAWRRVSRRRWEGQHYKKWWWMEGKEGGREGREEEAR